MIESIKTFVLISSIGLWWPFNYLQFDTIGKTILSIAWYLLLSSRSLLRTQSVLNQFCLNANKIQAQEIRFLWSLALTSTLLKGHFWTDRQTDNLRQIGQRQRNCGEKQNWFYGQHFCNSCFDCETGHKITAICITVYNTAFLICISVLYMSKCMIMIRAIR